MSARPPRLVEALLARMMPAPDREFQLGDLAEEYAARRGRSPSRAMLWYLWQVPRALVHARGPVARGLASTATLMTPGRDLRHAARGLARTPGVTLTAVVTLALGIGANTAIYTLLDHALLRPLPFPEPGRLVRVYNGLGDGGPDRWNLSFPDYADIRDAASSFERLGAWRSVTPALTLPDQSRAVRVNVAAVTANVMPMLGIEPQLGRGIQAQDDALDAAERVAVISHGLWRDLFGASQQILGSRIRLDEDEYTVVGVMGPEWGGGDAGSLLPAWGTDVWLPYRASMALEGIDIRGLSNVMVVGKLAPGARVEQAADELSGINRALAEEYPDSRGTHVLRAIPLQEVVRADSRSRLWLLYGAVVLVLLIAGTNVAHLLIARGAARSRELAVRMALGASRTGVLRLVLAESTLLALLGCVAGWGLGRLLLLAAAANPVLALPGGEDPSLDLRVLGVTAALSLATGLLFGAFPAWRASRQAPEEALRLTASRTSSGRRLARRGLAVVELAVALVLLVGATLTLQSLTRVLHSDPGFEPEGVLTARIQQPLDFVDARWKESVAFFASLVERLDTAPGVESAAAGYWLPVETGWNNSFELPEGMTPPAGQDNAFARFRPVTPGYFATAGIRLLRGRRFGADDTSGAPGVVIVNEAFVHRYFPGEDPLGVHIGCTNWWGALQGSCEIVGVVADVSFDGRSRNVEPATYFPHAQQPVREMSVLVRTTGDPTSLVGTLRAAVEELDPTLPLDNVATLSERLADTEAPRRAVVQLLAGFALLALMLAGVGVYGIMAFLVTERTREIGIRMALGASAPRVRRMVLVEGMGLAAVGLLIGGGGAALASRVIESQLFRTPPYDPAAFAGAAAFLAAAALAASWLPALRATRVDPMRSLRAD